MHLLSVHERKGVTVAHIVWPFFSPSPAFKTFRWVPTSEKPVFLSFAYVGGTFGTIITYPVEIFL